MPAVYVFHIRASAQQSEPAGRKGVRGKAYMGLSCIMHMPTSAWDPHEFLEHLQPTSHIGIITPSAAAAACMQAWSLHTILPSCPFRRWPLLPTPPVAILSIIVIPFPGLILRLILSAILHLSYLQAVPGEKDAKRTLCCSNAA